MDLLKQLNEGSNIGWGRFLRATQHLVGERGEKKEIAIIYYCYKYTLLRPCVALWTMVVVRVIQ